MLWHGSPIAPCVSSALAEPEPLPPQARDRRRTHHGSVSMARVLHVAHPASPRRGSMQILPANQPTNQPTMMTKLDETLLACARLRCPGFFEAVCCSKPELFGTMRTRPHCARRPTRLLVGRVQQSALMASSERHVLNPSPAVRSGSMWHLFGLRSAAQITRTAKPRAMARSHYEFFKAVPDGARLGSCHIMELGRFCACLKMEWSAALLVKVNRRALARSVQSY